LGPIYEGTLSIETQLDKLPITNCRPFINRRSQADLIWPDNTILNFNNITYHLKIKLPLYFTDSSCENSDSSRTPRDVHFKAYQEDTGFHMLGNFIGVPYKDKIEATMTTIVGDAVNTACTFKQKY
jgi:hypothetical protein